MRHKNVAQSWRNKEKFSNVNFSISLAREIINSYLILLILRNKQNVK